MRRALQRSLVGLAAAACAAATAPAALAWTRSAPAAGDPQTTWVVTRNTITIRSANPVLLRFVRGSSVLLSCSSSAQHPPPIARWGRNASSITARVKAANGRDVTSCNAVGVGRAPGFRIPIVFSRAGFTSQWRRSFASIPPPGPLLAHAQLSGYWNVVQLRVGPAFLNRLGIVVRLPPAPVLARKLGRSRLRYAPTLAGVTAPHVVYVIGTGSGPKKLELAVIGFDGKLYTLRTTVGANSHPRFGTG